MFNLIETGIPVYAPHTDMGATTEYSFVINPTSVDIGFPRQPTPEHWKKVFAGLPENWFDGDEQRKAAALMDGYTDGMFWALAHSSDYKSQGQQTASRIPTIRIISPHVSPVFLEPYTRICQDRTVVGGVAARYLWKAPTDVNEVIHYTHPESGKVTVNNIAISCPAHKGSWLEWFHLAGVDAGFKAGLWQREPKMFQIHQAVPGPSPARDAQPVHYLTLNMQKEYENLHPYVRPIDIIKWLNQRLTIADEYKKDHKPSFKMPSDQPDNLSLTPVGEDIFLEPASGSSWMGLDMPAWLIG